VGEVDRVTLPWTAAEASGALEIKRVLDLCSPQGNLLNVHSHKYSGLANSKVINIYANADGGVSITKIKADAKPNQVASARSHVSLKRTTGPRRANKIAAAETAGKGYRSDLRKVSRVLRCGSGILFPHPRLPVTRSEPHRTPPRGLTTPHLERSYKFGSMGTGCKPAATSTHLSPFPSSPSPCENDSMLGGDVHLTTLSSSLMYPAPRVRLRCYTCRVLARY